jgi:hypothetical protein
MVRPGREQTVGVKHGGERLALGLGDAGLAFVPGKLFGGVQGQRSRVGRKLPPGALQFVPRQRQQPGARVEALAAQDF